jgi:predicted flap endonuclease-1-like 5' DNA nuclease
MPKFHLTGPVRIAAALALALTIGSGAARASHYAVADVPRLITPEQARKLHKANVETTEQLLEKAAKPADRKTLAKASGLAPAELYAMAKRCDLLRIKGVGTEMVLLFEAAGITSTAELIKRDAATLTTAVLNANKTAKISEKPPTEPQLADWIEQAKKLPQVVEAGK